MSELLYTIDKMRRISNELNFIISSTKEDPYHLIRAKNSIDELMWAQEIEVQVFNDAMNVEDNNV